MRKKEIAESCTYAGPSITGAQIMLLQAASSQLDASETLAFTNLLAKVSKVMVQDAVLHGEPARTPMRGSPSSSQAQKALDEAFEAA
eukprot:4982438-Karenia_brevis.AAC.1